MPGMDYLCPAKGAVGQPGSMEPDLLTIRRIDILIVQIITHTQKPPVIVITPDFFPSQIPVIDGQAIFRSSDGRNDPLCDPFLHTQGDEGITDADGVFSQNLSYEAASWNSSGCRYSSRRNSSS